SPRNDLGTLRKFWEPGRALLLAGVLSLGCSGVQAALDREIAEGSMGENYDEEIADNDHQFGPQVYTTKPGAGANLYPDEEYTHVFGMTFGHDEEPVVAELKKKYKAMLKTSSEGSVTDWCVPWSGRRVRARFASCRRRVPLCTRSDSTRSSGSRSRPASSRGSLRLSTSLARPRGRQPPTHR